MADMGPASFPPPPTRQPPAAPPPVGPPPVTPATSIGMTLAQLGIFIAAIASCTWWIASNMATQKSLDELNGRLSNMATQKSLDELNANLREVSKQLGTLSETVAVLKDRSDNAEKKSP